MNGVVSENIDSDDDEPTGLQPKHLPDIMTTCEEDVLIKEYLKGQVGQTADYCIVGGRSNCRWYAYYVYNYIIENILNPMRKYYYIMVLFLLCVNTGCTLIFPQKMPDDVHINPDKCIALGLGSDNCAVYRFPNDEKTRRIFNQWWSHTKTLGTNSLVPYTRPKYRIYFSQQLKVYFCEHNNHGLVMIYSGKKKDGDPFFYKKANKYDIALMNHVRDIVKKTKRLSDSEAESLGLKCNKHFSYSPEMYHDE